MKKTVFNLSIRCHYPNGEPTQHRQDMKLTDIPKWVEAYKFTHPKCTAVSIKIWYADAEK